MRQLVLTGDPFTPFAEDQPSGVLPLLFFVVLCGTGALTSNERAHGILALAMLGFFVLNLTAL